MSSLKVTDIHPMGFGVIKPPDAKVMFAPGVCPGDEGVFELVESFRSHAIVRLVKLTVPSKFRVKPFCQHHGFSNSHCGGCAWGFIDYHFQLELKRKIIEAQLKYHRISYDKPVTVNPTIPDLGYRDTARFKQDGAKVGFHAYKSNDVIDIEYCPVLAPRLNSLLKDLRRNGQDFNVDHDFKQANEMQNQIIKQRLKHFLHRCCVTKQTRILECFSGSGNFTEVIRQFGRVVCLEKSHQAVEYGQQKFASSNVSFKQQDLYGTLNIDLNDFDGIVLNPPRSGWKHVREIFVSYPNLKWMIYISCSIQYVLSDIKPLQSFGIIEHLESFDMFPHTPHFETIVLWLRNDFIPD
jgi:23S rRNA (uracil1939-C5)-methyltransferase